MLSVFFIDNHRLIVKTKFRNAEQNTGIGQNCVHYHCSPIESGAFETQSPGFVISVMRCHRRREGFLLVQGLEYILSCCLLVQGLECILSCIKIKLQNHFKRYVHISVAIDERAHTQNAQSLVHVVRVFSRRELLEVSILVKKLLIQNITHLFSIVCAGIITNRL